MQYYILKKNGERIYSGSEWERVSELVPRHSTDHKGDRYSLSSIESENGSYKFL